jgi:hypothetical protein
MVRGCGMKEKQGSDSSASYPTFLLGIGLDANPLPYC